MGEAKFPRVPRGFEKIPVPKLGGFCGCPNSLLERARVLQTLWKFKEALEDCNEILRHEPNYPEALVERAISRSAEAFQWSNEDAEDLRRAIAERPDYEKAWTNLAECLFGPDRLEEAVEAASKALELNPEDENSVKRLRGILEDAQKKKQKREKALADYHKFVQSYRRAKIFSHKKGAQIKEEEFDKAVSETSKLLLLDPRDVASRLKRVAACIGTGDLEKASKDLEELLDRYPDDPDFLKMTEVVEFFWDLENGAARS